MFVFVVVGSVIVDYYIIEAMHKSTNQRYRKTLLVVSVSINVGLLLYFKYANFFVENVDVLLNSLGYENVRWTQVALPVGISFYTFQTLTYAIDVYRGVHKPLRNPFQYLVYILLFPQLIAGPIVRFNQIADQIESRQHLETIDNKLLGFFRFGIGLAKKVLIANVLGAEADEAFALAEGELTSSIAWIGIIAYTFQIYYDFSGYSDMAIGMGRMMGFKFPENFNNPYISQNITEFWRRWHMTLGSWLRDYVYIPLGGSRVAPWRIYVNLMLVMAISGLWHGADSINFLLWGVLHGLAMVTQRLWEQNGGPKLPALIAWGITMLFVFTAWVLFRAPDLATAWAMYQGQLGLHGFGLSEEVALILRPMHALTMLLALVAASWPLWRERRAMPLPRMAQDTLALWPLLGMLIATALMSSRGASPFLYFQF